MPRYSERAGANPSVSTMARRTTGKRKSFEQKMMSLMKAALVPYIDRFGYLSTTYDASNQYPLEYATYDAGATYNYPVYLYELNTLPLGNGVRTACPMMVLQRNAAGLYFFQGSGLNSRDPDDTSAYYFPYNELAPGAISSITPASQGPNVYMDWADIRMSIVGPKKTPAKMSVQLIRWTSEDIIPPCLATPTATPAVAPSVTNGRNQPSGGTRDEYDWNAWWLEYNAKLLGNPLNIRNGSTVSCPYQVLKTCTYTFQPRVTTEDAITGGTGDTRLLKWFNRVGKTFNYFQQDNAGPNAVTAAEEIKPVENFTSSPSLDTHAKDRARMFLLISAYTPVQRDGTTDRTTSDICCQFDIQVRRKFYYTEHQ